MSLHDDLDRLDPANLPPAVRGRVRAIAASDPDLDRRALARRILATADPDPGDSYTRGAARGAAYDPTGGSGITYETDRPDNVRKA